jgi:hypothetical protein
MHVLRRVLRYRGDLRGQRLDERDSERAGAAFTRQRGGVETRGLTDPADNFGMRRRGRRPRQRPLEARHRGEELLVGQQSGANLVGEEKLEAQ